MDQVTGAPLMLEDLQVGQRFGTRSHTLDAEQIKRFAAQFDPQPFHLDEDQARQTVFGRLVASGWHTAAITMRLLARGELRLAGGIVGKGGDLTWPRPVHPGDTLHVESEIVALAPSRSRADHGWATVRSTTLNQRGEAVQVFTARLLVPRRGGTSADG